MALIEDQIKRLHEMAASERPDIPINVCIGVNGIYAEGHKPFVIRTQVPSGDSLAREFDDLEDALKVPGAHAYGSSALCNACSNLQSKLLI